ARGRAPRPASLVARRDQPSATAPRPAPCSQLRDLFAGYLAPRRARHWAPDRRGPSSRDQPSGWSAVFTTSMGIHASGTPAASTTPRYVPGGRSERTDTTTPRLERAGRLVTEGSNRTEAAGSTAPSDAGRSPRGTAPRESSAALRLGTHPPASAPPVLPPDGVGHMTTRTTPVDVAVATSSVATCEPLSGRPVLPGVRN